MTKDSNDFPGYYIAPPIKKMLDKGKNKVIKQDWDRVYIIDGSEGSGKSLLALQLGYYLDPTLNLNRITFSGKEFSEAINKASKNQCIIFDEAFNGLSSSGATSRLNRLIVSKLMECRQKNLFLIIVLPTIFLLQKYAAIFRSKVLFHVYTTRSGNRGYYKVYNQKNKRILYLTGLKMYSYSKPWIKKSFRFYGKYPIDEEAYRKKKLEMIKSQEPLEKLSRNEKWLITLIRLAKEEYGITYKSIAEGLKKRGCPIDPDTITRKLSKIPPNSQKNN